jgi:hypothetical protein
MFTDGRAAANVSGAVSLSASEWRSVVLSANPGESCQFDAEARYVHREPVPPRRPLAWTIAARVIAWSGTEATLDVRIERNDTIRAPENDSNRPSRRLILRQGEHRVVDMASLPRRDCGTVQFEVELVVDEPEPLRDAVLSYDVWLLHRDADGRERTARFGTSGLQGREVPYTFTPLRQRADGTAVREGPGQILTTIGGTLRGRARLDGRLDLTVGASRTISSRSSGIGDGGTKQLTVEDGETVELELPTVTSGSLPDVDLHRFLAVQATAVRVTARRVR